MKSDKMDISDLLADQTFINYCKKSSPADVAFWEDYQVKNPDSKLLIAQASEAFSSLFNALAAADMEEQVTRLKNRLNMAEPTRIVQMDGAEKKKPGIKLQGLLKITAAAAVFAVATFSIFKYNNGTKAKAVKTFVAAYGERKNIQLPDGSDITLNAGSKIEIKEDFGVNTRDVYLEGEAFFDVKHNARLPFIVHTPAMDIKALGTAFNVKAYLNETVTETSLIRGLVEVTLKENNNRTMLLYPNQKIKWQHAGAAISNDQLSNKESTTESYETDSLLEKLAVTEEGDIKETAWKQNKLIFEDELFSDIALSLERWYGVKIEFKDEALRNYRFTGVFVKEDLNTLLDFLQESRSFKYKIEPAEPLKVNLYR